MTAAIPERHKTRYKLGESQLAILPNPEDDPEEKFEGCRFSHEEVMALIEELAALREKVERLENDGFTIKELDQLASRLAEPTTQPAPEGDDAHAGTSI